MFHVNCLFLLLNRKIYQKKYPPFAFAVDPLWAAGIGLFWPVGRLLYALGYYQSAERRVLGLLISMPPLYVFVLGSMIAMVMALAKA